MKPSSYLPDITYQVVTQMGLELLATRFGLLLHLWVTLFIFLKETWLVGPYNSISKEGYTGKLNAGWPEPKLVLTYRHTVLQQQVSEHAHWHPAVTLASQLPGTGEVTHTRLVSMNSCCTEAQGCGEAQGEPVQVGTSWRKAASKEESPNELTQTCIVLSTYKAPLHSLVYFHSQQPREAVITGTCP